MATTRNIRSDRARISSQTHEVAYAGSQLGKGGAARVRQAKQALGRTASRSRVLRRARRATTAR